MCHRQMTGCCIFALAFTKGYWASYPLPPRQFSIEYDSHWGKASIKLCTQWSEITFAVWNILHLFIYLFIYSFFNKILKLSDMRHP